MLSCVSLALVCMSMSAAVERERELVIDVGFSVGADTAMYLEAGYKVVAIEANPFLVAWALQTEPFRLAVNEGRLVLLHRAVGERSGQNLTFFVNPCDHYQSSVEYDPNAAWTLCPLVPVSVRSVTCTQILKQDNTLLVWRRFCNM